MITASNMSCRSSASYTFTHQTYDPKTNQSKRVPGFDQDGLIWQAEEVLENGQWKRYYGFVGRHIVAKVPAEEIEFVTGGRP